MSRRGSRSSSGPIVGEERQRGVVREKSYVVHLIDRGDREKGIEEIIADYKRRFEQESVLRIRDTACVSF